MENLAHIQRAIDTIEENLRQPISIGYLARRAGYSFWHFQRVFAAVVGEPAGFYIRRRRLTAAAEELRTTRRRILDVALDFQFESHEAFTRAFKGLFHLNPGEVRGRRHFIEGLARPQLTREKLRHLARQAAMKPVIVNLEPLTLIGFEARFISAMSPDANNFQVIPPLWHALTAHRAELDPPLDRFSYGACRCLPEKQRRRDDELVYLAGVNAKPRARVPAGMVRWKIPALTYAHFTHRGPISRLSETINYIYGAWMPRSDYRRNERGPELERYDDRFRDGGQDCELDYLVPVIRRT